MGVSARILVGVDGTEWGLEALRQAPALASRQRCARGRRWIRHRPCTPACRPRTSQRSHQGSGGGARCRGRRRCTRRAREAGRRAAARAHDLDATLVALGGRRTSRFLGAILGDTGTALLDDAACSLLQTSSRALVIVGSRGMRGLRATGSVSPRVAHQAHGTALVITARRASALPRRALAASAASAASPRSPRSRRRR